uniref:Zinc finger protein 830 n=1 Tax=Tetraodon nigroviridis TaxID=99883 RepID=H3C1V5_TETNG
MAPSKKEKKVVNQEELRRLMREKQRQSTEKKRVESPFAKYNGLGHLSCVLCNVQVKSELLWPTHVLGKPHKEKVAELKGAKTPTVTQQTQPVKRKAADSEYVSGKKAKPTSGNPASLTLLAGVYEDEDGEDGDEEEKDKPVPETAELPADFFDSSIPSTPAISHSGSILKADVQEKSAEKKENSAEALPEGFFDDPVRDAQVRNVDAPKDQLDKEWEEFQKEMRLVNTKSEAIVAEDDEEGRIERQIDEIDEQIECYRRVEVLRDRRDAVRRRPLPRKDVLLGLLSQDWRAKGALA